jgi:hypothetical protein
MIKKISIFLTILFLAGCGTPPAQHLVEECKRTTPNMSGARWDCLMRASEQTEYENRLEEQRRQEQRAKAYAEALVNRCESFGIRRGSSEMSQCVYQQQQLEMQNATNAQILQQQREAAGLRALQGAAAISRPQPIYTPPPSNINCTSTQWGNTVNTNCR